MRLIILPKIVVSCVRFSPIDIFSNKQFTSLLMGLKFFIIIIYRLTEEEIDVVTIEKPKRKRLPQVTDEPPAKRLKPIAVKPKVAMSVSSPTKESKKDLKRQNSSTSDEEGENISKRATHNVLERKRRNDLKTSFHVLREEVPDLKDNERAPKVTILRKAKDFVDKLQKEETRLLAELDRERRRNEELLDRFHALGQKRK